VHAVVIYNTVREPLILQLHGLSTNWLGETDTSDRSGGPEITNEK